MGFTNELSQCHQTTRSWLYRIESFSGSELNRIVFFSGELPITSIQFMLFLSALFFHIILKHLYHRELRVRWWLISTVAVDNCVQSCNNNNNIDPVCCTEGGAPRVREACSNLKMKL